MKTTEFFKELTNYTFVGNVNYTASSHIIDIYSSKDNDKTTQKTLATVDVVHPYSFNTTFEAFNELTFGQQKTLTNKINQYVSTPVDQRQEDKVFIVPVIPGSKTLKPKYLFKADGGITVRDLSKETVNNKEVDSRYLFTKSRLNTYALENKYLNLNYAQEYTPAGQVNILDNKTSVGLGV